MEHPEEYRNRAEEFICELTREFYMNRAGLKDSLNASEIYMGYQDLFEKQNVLQLLQPIRSLRRDNSPEASGRACIWQLSQQTDSWIWL